MLSKKEIRDNRKRIIEHLNEVDRPGIENLIGWLEGSDFFTAPASTMFHGNYKGGLAVHSYRVYEEFKRQAEHYNLDVPEEGMFLTGILHDCCKVDYYIPNELKSGNISKSKPYKVEDTFPVGHGEKSVIVAQRYIQLTEQESMIIRWHMGYSDPAWDDSKEKVEKAFPEVLLFHHVDKEVSLLYGL